MNLLAALSVELRGDTKPLDADMEKAVKAAKRAGERIADNLKSEVAQRLSGGVGLGGLVSESLTGAAGVGLIGRVFQGARFASNAAAEIGYYRRQLTGIAQDAGLAERAVKRLSDVAGASNFDTDQVFGLGVSLSNKYNNVGLGSANTAKLLDAAAAGGVENRNFGDFAHEIAMVAGRGFESVGMETMEALKRAMPTLNSQAAQTMGLSASAANMRMRSMTGDQLLNLLLKIGERNQGAAARVAGADPQSVFANIKDDLQIGLAPTGQLINNALLPAVGGVKSLTGRFKDLNAATGGGAGLVTGVALLGVGVRMTIPLAFTAARVIGGLNVALGRLAVMGGAATAGTNVAATGAAGRGIGGVPAVVGRLGGTVGLLTIAAGTLATVAGGMLMQSKDRGVSGLGRYLAGAGGGAAVGGLVGSVIPGIGTAAGSAIGGGLGFIGAMIPDLARRGIDSDPKRLAEERKAINDRAMKLDGMTNKQIDAANAMKDAAVALKQSASSAVGGGGRSRWGASQAEREWVTMHLMTTRLTGVG